MDERRTQWLARTACEEAPSTVRRTHKRVSSESCSQQIIFLSVIYK